jgi:hypothetical protein
MKIAGIIVNVLAAVIAVAIICASVSIECNEHGIMWELQEKTNIIIALLLMTVTLLFAQVYCGGSKK